MPEGENLRKRDRHTAGKTVKPQNGMIYRKPFGQPEPEANGQEKNENTKEPDGMQHPDAPWR
jgi:hypothetical protein